MAEDNGLTRLCCRQTAIGMIGIAESGGVVTNLYFLEKSGDRSAETAGTPLLDEAFRQFDAWLEGRIRTFTLPIAADGTAFAQRVWRALLEIPYGDTASYGEIATLIGVPGASRAVGSACRRNPLPIFIPCHRVVCSDGGIGGYLGGTEIKQRLLDLERRDSE
jgi:methylated-DNA-[protein]-cysteine S-methyltransferase